MKLLRWRAFQHKQKYTHVHDFTVQHHGAFHNLSDADNELVVREEPHVLSENSGRADDCTDDKLRPFMKSKTDEAPPIRTTLQAALRFQVMQGFEQTRELWFLLRPKQMAEDVKSNRAEPRRISELSADTSSKTDKEPRIHTAGPKQAQQ